MIERNYDMKKIFLTFAVLFVMVFNVSAQSDGFFRDGAGSAGYRERGSGDMPIIPSGQPGALHGDQGAPLGSGLLVLTALGAGYAVARKNTRRGE